MTYGDLKSLTAGLLIGDNNLPKDDSIFKALLSYAFNMISNKAEALRLMTMTSTEDIIRLGPGEYLVRRPNMPTSDSDELDIDHELGFVAARYIASMISKERVDIHQQYGDDEILKYNGKVYQILEKVKIEEDNKKCNSGCGNGY